MSILTRKRKPQVAPEPATDELRIGTKFAWSEPGSSHVNRDTTIVAVRWNEWESKAQKRRVATVLVVDAATYDDDDKYAYLNVVPNEDGTVWTVQHAQWYFRLGDAAAAYYVD
jgi:hypothetical protein